MPAPATIHPPIPPAPQRIPPRSARTPFPAGALRAILVPAVLGAILIPVDHPGIGWLLTGLTAALALALVDRRARTQCKHAGSENSHTDGATAYGVAFDLDKPAETIAPQQFRARWWWAALTVGLLAVGAVRASGWLFACCLLAAVVTGSLAIVGRRSIHGLWHDAIAVPLAAVTVPPWLIRGITGRTTTSSARGRIALSVAVTAGLLLVFVPLLAGADALFAGLIGGITPTVHAATVIRWLVVGILVAALTAGALYVLAGPPPAHTTGEAATGMRWRPLEWALPVAALTVLYAVFVAVQLTALFGGDDYVRRTAGLTYAEYARSGFWQLTAVTVLTLAVLSAVLRWAARDTPARRLLLRALLTPVIALTLTIVASALHRMWTYQQAYGFTVPRLLVEAGELWIGLLYLLTLAAVYHHHAWLPRAAVATAAATLLALAATDPERLIADRNIDRWQSGKDLDTTYLATLSADIAPALDRLPTPLRTTLLDPLRHHPDNNTWGHWNLARARLTNQR
ncbi:DUF4173 domain-containing protein [Nocardia terpenica]|uniref:DUF4153 domain-containing protein n=1 Tax=Nocardia terpenica TaxID=455432 RepID=UPI002FE05F87